jgi:hypothetical protein
MNFIHDCQNFAPFDMLLSYWGLSCVTFYIYGYPYFSRGWRWRYDPYRWAALGGLATPLCLSTRRLSLSTRACPAARWPSPCLLTRAARWPELRILGLCGQETIESAALWVLTDFCDHNPTEVALSPFGLFSAVDPHDLAYWTVWATCCRSYFCSRFRWTSRKRWRIA